MEIAALRAAQAYYDGADLGRRGSSIRRSGASSEVVTSRSLPALRNGSRDLVRNNPHAHRGVQAIVSNTIGTGILPRFKRNQQTVRELQSLALDTIDTPLIDQNGQLDYYGMQSLAWNTVVESGEVLVVRKWVKDRFPLRVQVLEPDYLDTSKDQLRSTGGERTSQGIRFDRNGRRLGYWLYREHPGGMSRSIDSEFVPARDVIHLYRVERPGQIRGIPWLSPIVLRLADFSDYEDAQLLRQKIAACFAVFIYDAMAPVPGVDQTEEKRLEELEPGLIVRHAPGRQTTFAQPPQVLDYKDYAKVSLRAMAAGLGVSYEALTGDLEGVNFSSGRMGWLEFQRNIEQWRWLTCIPQLCTPMMTWFLDAAALMRINIQGVQIRHNPPAREMISPEREVPAKQKQLASGQLTLRQIVEQGSGRDLEEHLDEMQEERGLLESHGIALDWTANDEPNEPKEDDDDE